MAIDKKNSKVLIIVAVIGLTGTLGGAFIANLDKFFEDAPLPQPPEPPPPDPTDWPIFADVPFEIPPDNWSLGSFSTVEVSQLEIGVLEGKYRWSMQFGESFPNQNPTWQRVIFLPYAPQVEFKVAVDIRVVQMSGYTTVALIFGAIGNADYVFAINSKSQYSLHYFDGQKMSTIINWKIADFDITETNRIAVTSVDGRLKLFINSKPFGEIRKPDFAGGTFSLGVTSVELANVVVEFDNFVLRVPR